MSQLSVFPLMTHVAIRVDLTQCDEAPGEPHQDSVHQKAVRFFHSSIAGGPVREKRTRKITLVIAVIFEQIGATVLRERINVIVVLVQLNSESGT